MKMISIDPATHYTGYAIWENEGVIANPKSINLIQWGVLRATAKESFDRRCLEINSKLRNLIVTHEMTHCVCEFPEFQSGQRGMDAARSGDTLKLSYLCGCIATGWHLHVALSMAIRMQNPEMSEGKESPEPLVVWLSPSRWKGQLPKKVCAERCFSAYGWKAQTEIDKNASDAIMIGDYQVKDLGLVPGLSSGATMVNL